MVSKLATRLPIPKESVTDFELLLLKSHGFTCKDSLLEPDKYCFHADGFIQNYVSQYDYINDFDIEEALKIPENSEYLDQNYCLKGKKIIDMEYYFIFSNIIKRDKSLSYIEIEGSFERSIDFTAHDMSHLLNQNRLCPGRFGGFAELITAEGLISKDTNRILADAYYELEHTLNFSELLSEIALSVRRFIAYCRA